MGGLVDGIMETQVGGYKHVWEDKWQKGWVFERGVCELGLESWIEAEFRGWMDGWKDGWMDGWKDVISTTLFQGQFQILLGPVKEMKHVPYTRLVLKWQCRHSIYIRNVARRIKRHNPFSFSGPLEQWGFILYTCPGGYVQTITKLIWHPSVSSTKCLFATFYRGDTNACVLVMFCFWRNIM